MNKEDFIKANEKLSKEDIIADYWKSEEELIKKIGIENKNYLLHQENQELKKQLEKVEAMEKYMCRYALHNEEKIDMLNTQQKEFIEYLENEIKERTIQKVGYHPNTQLLIEQIIETEKMVLSKYKEIIGGKEWVESYIK